MIKRFVFAAAAMTAVLCSCNEKGKDYEPLTSDAQELNLTVGESAVVSVSGGSGEIEVFLRMRQWLWPWPEILVR